MNRLIGHLALLSLLMLLSSYCAAGWVQVKDKEGIQIYTQEVVGSPFVMAKAIITIEAEPKAILKVLDNNSEHPKWVPYLLESRKLQAVSATERLEYNLFDAPWPASNRDFIFRVKAISSNQKNTLIYSMKSESSSLVPEAEDVVRGILHESTFKLTQLEPGKTKVELLFQADPRGWIPNWITNLVQRAWPYKVLKGLRTETLATSKNPRP